MNKYYNETWGKNVGEESRKSWIDKYWSSFFDKYMGGKGLDIGFSGYLSDIKPILPTAIGVDINYPGYDGRTLPFPDNSQDFTYSSHCLEHIDDYRNAIRDWFRVTKKGGHIIIVVPHICLYEKKESLPSRWNADHKRFYWTSDLVREVENSLKGNTYRIRHLQDNDEGHDYNQPDTEHSKWLYEIELVLEKL